MKIQYREFNKSMDIDYPTNSYEMIIPEIDEDKTLKGFNHEGVLLLKNTIDKLEYYIYDSSIPASYDINQIINEYYKNRCVVHLYIKSNDNILNQTGRLHRKTVDGVVKYFINDIDIEEFLFNNTEQNVHIKIKRIDATEGDNGENEAREHKEKENG